jgi:hypothetical protein
MSKKIMFDNSCVVVARQVIGALHRLNAVLL